MLLVVRNRVINKSALQIVENDFISCIDSIIYPIARGHFVNKTQLESASSLALVTVARAFC